MKNHLKSLSLLILVAMVALTACQSIDQPKGTAKDYSTFRFIRTGPVNDDRFAKPSQDRDLIAQDAIRQEFEAAGLAFAPEGADLMVSYLFIRQDNVSTLAVPTYYGDDYRDIQSFAHKKGVLKGTDHEQFVRGAIVIDIIDVSENKLIYRDFSVRDIMGVDSSEQAEPLIRSAVAEALASFLNGEA
jgi:hypothetical protein